MGTRAAAFAGKVRSLQNSYNRIVTGVVPQPSGSDIAGVLGHFSQTLLGVLKDVPSIPIEVIRSKDKDDSRIALFPSLDYIGLFNVLINLYDVVPIIQTGRQQFAEALLHTLCCLVPFLPHDYMDTIPYIIATAFPNFPSAIHKDMIEKLCFNVLPFTIQSQIQKTTGPNAQHFSDIENLSFANISIPAILLMILLWAELPSLHTLLIETLMKLKPDVAHDLFCVIAHGTVKARCPAIELVFQYWPELNPSAADRKALVEKHTPWTPLPCAYENCSNVISNEAVRMVLDHKVAIGNNWDRIPPLLVCLECADKIYTGKSRETLVDILSPMETIPFACESKTCQSPQNQKVPIVTCFSSECAMLNVNKPVRLCKNCHHERHLKPESFEGEVSKAQSKHLFHETIQSPWSMDSESQSYIVEGIVSLLKEAQPIQEKSGKENLTAGSSADKARGLPSQGLPNDESQETMALEERQLLSRYGVWMMTSLCTPVEKTPDEVLGRLLAMLFQWFHCTACLPDDQAGSALERLKGDCIHGWLMKVVKTHFNVFVNCLLPHPLDYAKVGGHWDCWPSQANQIKEGFKRLLCLVPYDIITPDVWSYIMPYWMECFRHEIPEEELSELKILLSKVLDPDLSPLGFSTKQMYEFISVRLDNTSATVQDQALSWIQMLTMLEVPVPIKLLITMLQSGLKSLANKNRSNEPFKGLGKVFPHQASMKERKQAQEEEQKIMSLLRSQPTLGAVTPSGKTSVEPPTIIKLPPEPIPLTEDEAQVSCYILMLDILVKQMELQEVPAHKGLDKEQAQPLLTMLRDILTAPWPGTHSCEDVQLLDAHGELDCPQCQMCELSAIWYQLALVLIEYISPIVEISVTDQAADPMGVRTTSPAPSSPSRSGAGHDNSSVPNVGAAESSGKKVWYTSQGRFEFDIEDLSIELQLFYVLLNELENHKDADILYHLLGALKVMCLHAEVLNKAVKTNRGFLVWCQENLLMHNLWTLLQAEFSQISQICVPLLLHCITLPSGRDMFWKLVEEDFHDENWRARFTAVERVTTMAHFLDATSVKNSPSLQSSLANSFCYLVHCLDDIESTVAQRALLNLETIKTTSLKLLLWCLETQFDLVIVDRPMILQTVFQLYNHLNDRRFLTWDFFLNRFDALFLEAQIRLEKMGELNFTRDLKNTNVNSEAYQRKLTRAQEALNHAHISRSLSASVGARFEYKRAMSAPVQVISRRSDKMHGRQVSAPTVMRRKSSKVMGNSPQIPEKFQQTFAGSSPFISNVDKELELQIQEENHLMSVVHRTGEHQVDFDQDAEDSMHSLITLLMQFLSRPDHSHPSEEKAIQKNQSIVLRHLKILLGYSPVQKSFLILPNHLRSLPVFSAFITAMPKVLDFNYKMGNILLSTCIPLLIYSPSPQKYSHESNQLPLYSLWLLNSHVRQSWLMSVLIIIYKYEYNTQPLINQTRILVQIVINTLEAQLHKCKPTHHLLSPVTSRSRDMSTTSVEVMEMQRDHENEDQKETRSFHEASVPTSEAVSDEDVDEESSQRINDADTENEPKKNTADLVFERISEEKTSTSVDTSIRQSRSMAGEKETTADKSTSSDLEGLLSGEEKSTSNSIRNKDIEPAAIQDSTTQAGSLRNIPKSPDRPPLKRVEHIADTPVTEMNLSKDIGIGNPDLLDLAEQTRIQEGIQSVLKSFSSDKGKPSTVWSVGSISPSRVKSLLPEKPNFERLLPIGPPREPSPKPVLFKSYTYHEHHHHHHSHSARDKNLPPFVRSPGEMHLPSQERLLPIGPFQERSRSKSPMTPHTPEACSAASDLVDEEDLKTSFSPHKIPETTIHLKDADRVPIPLDAVVQLPPAPNTILDPGFEVLKVESTPKPPPKKKKKDKRDKENKNDKSSGSKSSSDKNGEKSEPTTPKVATKSMNKVTAQSTLESLGQSVSIDLKDEPIPGSSDSCHQTKNPSGTQRYKQRRQRKTGVKSTDIQRMDSKGGQSVASGGVAAGVQRRARKTDTSPTTGLPSKRSSASQSSVGGTGAGTPTTVPSDHDGIHERCLTCSNVYQEFSEEEIGMCIVILRTFIHREPSLSASILPEILKLVSRFTTYFPYPWMKESNVHLPGNVSCIAKQFLRCTYHQMSSNGIFQQLFKSHFPDPEFFRAMANSLTDFTEVNQVTPLITLFVDLNERKHLPTIPELMHILSNIALYLESMQMDLMSTSSQSWIVFFPHFDNFLRNFQLLYQTYPGFSVSPLLRIFIQTLKLPSILGNRILLESYTKIVLQAIHATGGGGGDKEMIDACKDRIRELLS